LSTGSAVASDGVVDDLVDASVGNVPAALWFGAVVPKRHARRSVTRSLLKRQMRMAVAEQHGRGLPSGLWVIRLRAPFDRNQYPSAASDALLRAARAELADVMVHAAQRALAAAPC
jgi:ribonuclease P protein component